MVINPSTTHPPNNGADPASFFSTLQTGPTTPLYTGPFLDASAFPNYYALFFQFNYYRVVKCTLEWETSYPFQVGEGPNADGNGGWSRPRHGYYFVPGNNLTNVGSEAQPNPGYGNTGQMNMPNTLDAALNFPGVRWSYMPKKLICTWHPHIADTEVYQFDPVPPSSSLAYPTFKSGKLKRFPWLPTFIPTGTATTTANTIRSNLIKFSCPVYWCERNNVPGNTWVRPCLKMVIQFKGIRVQNDTIPGLNLGEGPDGNPDFGTVWMAGDEPGPVPPPPDEEDDEETSAPGRGL